MRKLPTVESMMDKEFVKFTVNTGIYEAIGILLDKGLLGVCVVDENNKLLGIVSEKDCLKVILQSGYHQAGQRHTVGDYFHEVEQTVAPGMGMVAIAQLFLESQYRRFAVVENGVLVGQITRRDVLRGIHKFVGDA